MEYLRIDREGRLRLAKKSEWVRKDTDDVAPHHEWTPYVGPVVWTGPDGKSHHRLMSYPGWLPVGHEKYSEEKTLSATYISRSPRGTPFPASKVNFIGEVGWWYNNYRGPIYRSYPEYQER